MSETRLEGLTYPELVGLHVSGPAPLGNIYLELRPGVMVLYGRNGVGKTRLVSALVEALQGVGCAGAPKSQRDLLFNWDIHRCPVEDTRRYSVDARLYGWRNLRGNPWGYKRDRGLGDYEERRRGYGSEKSWADDIESMITKQCERVGIHDSQFIGRATTLALNSQPEVMPSKWVVNLTACAAADTAAQGRFRLSSNPTKQVLYMHANPLAGINLFTLSNFLCSGYSDGLASMAHDEEMMVKFAQALQAEAERRSSTEQEIPKDSDGVPDSAENASSEARPIYATYWDSAAWDEDEWSMHVAESHFGTLLDSIRDPFRPEWSRADLPRWWADSIGIVDEQHPESPIDVITELPASSLDPITVSSLASRLQELIDPPTHSRKQTARNIGEVLLTSQGDGTYGINPDLAALTTSLAESANHWFGELLEHAPLLNLQILPPTAWTEHPPLCWTAIDATGALVPVAELSTAQQRWASFSIQLALLEESPLPKVVVLDEPEAALHRRAERHLADGLERLARDLGATVIVATHSPAFFKTPDARLVHVRRDELGCTMVDEMGRNFRSRLDELGLEASDLLQFCRTAVLVEGEHELIIFDELFRDEFATYGVEMFALRGASQLKNASDAQLLFRFSDAALCIVVDNEQSGRVEDIWRRAIAAQDAGENVLPILNEFTKGGWTAEAKFLSEFCALALRFTARHRVTFQPMTKPDIIDYLPLAAIAPRAAKKHSSWDEVRAAHAQSGTKVDFKSWMTSTYGASFDEATLRAAVQMLDHIPEDFTALTSRLLAGHRAQRA